MIAVFSRTSGKVVFGNPVGKEPDGERPPLAVGASLATCLVRVRLRLTAGAFDKDLRALPCTRKGHRPLARGTGAESGGKPENEVIEK